MRLFRQALEALGVGGRVVAADCRATAPALFAAHEREHVPRVSDPGYVDALLELCLRHDVRMLVPLIDPELPVIAAQAERFRAIGTVPLVSSPEAVRICADKRLTADFFCRNDIPTACLLDPAALLADPNAAYPVVLKPAAGSASNGVTTIRGAEELRFFLDRVPNALVQELVAGDEYTLDVLVDPRGAVRCVVPRLRMETRAGEVSKGMTVRAEAVIAAGRRVAEALPGAFGCLTLQCFVTPAGEIRFIEINPRFGGGFPLSAHAGADFPKWLIEWVLGRDSVIDPVGWRDGLVMLRYDAAYMVDRASIER